MRLFVRLIQKPRQPHFDQLVYLINRRNFLIQPHQDFFIAQPQYISECNLAVLLKDFVKLICFF